MVADNNLMRRLYSEETLHVAFLPKTPLKKIMFFSVESYITKMWTFTLFIP